MPAYPLVDGGAAAARDEAARNALVRRFSLRVTLVLIVLCNAVFLAGVWGSGVNLDELVKTPDLFNPASDICLRLTWQRLAGAPDPVRLCSEWMAATTSTGVCRRIIG
jgi:hypothetical protein